MPQYRTIPGNSKCYSEVAQSGCRALCVTVPELVACGVSDGYLRKAFVLQRTGEAYCWPHHKEGNTVFLHYDGLKEKYRRLIDTVHCDGVAADQWTTNRDAQRREQELKAVCSTLPEMVEVSDADIQELTQTGLFKLSEVQQVARAAGWLRLWRKLDVRTARRMGFASVVDLQTELFSLCMDDQARGFVRFPKPIGTIRVLDRKAREFANHGLQVLIGGYFGNANRGKIDSRVHAVLMDLAASPVKYSFEDIGLMYNTMPDYEALPRMTVSAIKQHLNKPAYRKVWYYARHGKLVGDNTYQSQSQRDTPSQPDYLWSIDGTTAQLYYRDADGKIRSDLYVYFVTDAHSGAIIGKSVAYAENAGMVTAALQDAIQTHGYKPRQVQYDNSSANVSEAVQGLIDNMSRVHFPCTPYLGRAKYVEEIIGHFQQQGQRQAENFKGGNVTTKSENSKANPELLKWLQKNPERLPNEDQAIEQLFKSIDTWNSRGCRRDAYGVWVGESKIARYRKEYEGRERLNYFDQLSLFMAELPKLYKYKQQGITLTISGKKYNFIVPDPDNSANDFIFSNVNMYNEFRVRVNINNPQYIQLLDKAGRPVELAYEKERFAACVADMKPGDGAKIRQFLTKQQEYGYDYAMRELHNQRRVLEQHGLRATGTESYFGANWNEKRGEYFGWQDTPKALFNAEENAAEDELNRIKERPAAGSRRTRDALEALKRM